MRSPALALLSALALLLAGCASKTDEPTPTSSTPTSSEPLQASNTTVNNSSSTNTSKANNTTARDPRMPENPGNCMGGMDMPGCTAAQYDYYYAQQKANAPPTPPDKELPLVVITLTPQGADKVGSATIDAGVMQLFVTVFLNDTAAGPFIATGAGVVDDVKITLKSETEAKTMTLAGSALSAGADPVAPLSHKVAATFMMPPAGDWTITVEGLGLNAVVTLAMVESYSM